MPEDCIRKIKLVKNLKETAAFGNTKCYIMLLQLCKRVDSFDKVSGSQRLFISWPIGSCLYAGYVLTQGCCNDSTQGESGLRDLWWATAQQGLAVIKLLRLRGCVSWYSDFYRSKFDVVQSSKLVLWYTYLFRSRRNLEFLGNAMRQTIAWLVWSPAGNVHPCWTPRSCSHCSWLWCFFAWITVNPLNLVKPPMNNWELRVPVCAETLACHRALWWTGALVIAEMGNWNQDSWDFTGNMEKTRQVTSLKLIYRSRCACPASSNPLSHAISLGRQRC